MYFDADKLVWSATLAKQYDEVKSIKSFLGTELSVFYFFSTTYLDFYTTYMVLYDRFGYNVDIQALRHIPFMFLYNKFSSPLDGSVRQQGDSICRKELYMS